MMEILGIHLDLDKIISVLLKIGLLTIVFIIALPSGKKIVEKSIKKLAHSKKVSPGRIKTLDKLLANVYAYIIRSEERRVGKERRHRGAATDDKRRQVGKKKRE